MTVQVFDDRSCSLGEGPLWHPLRNQLFWFDIIGKKLLSVDAEGPKSWQFDEFVSAAGWVDIDTLLVASASGLWRFNLTTGDRSLVCHLEHNNAVTRSNDGRADPWGGFWIGTMGIDANPPRVPSTGTIKALSSVFSQRLRSRMRSASHLTDHSLTSPIRRRDR